MLRKRPWRRMRRDEAVGETESQREFVLSGLGGVELGVVVVEVVAEARGEGRGDLEVLHAQERAGRSAADDDSLVEAQRRDDRHAGPGLGEVVRSRAFKTKDLRPRPS